MYQTINKIIVIGGNAAGPAAAAKAKRVNPDAEVILFEAGNFISTGTCELPYLLSGEIDDYEKILHFNPDTFFAKKGVKVYTNHYVKSIDIRRKEIEVVDKSTNHIVEFEYDKLILTTGSIAKELPNLPYSIENVHSLKSVHDYLGIRKNLLENEIEKVLIVGSGYIGLEAADGFSKAGYNVTILEQAELPMPAAESEVGFLIKDILEKNNIEFLNVEEDTRFIVKDNKLKQLKHQGRFLDYDLVVVSVGIKPNNKLAESIGLKLGNYGGLLVDSRLKTSNPNIFAAGDNIEVINRITNSHDYLPLATYAHSYGHIAGENAAGGNKIAKPVILNSAFKIFDHSIAQVGLTSEQAAELFANSKSVSAVANNIIKVMPNSKKVFGKIVYDNYSKLILGASFVGSQEVVGFADLISSMIYNKNSVLSLTDIDYNYTPPLSPFVNLLSILGRKIQENK